jgi:hypothetical protein
MGAARAAGPHAKREEFIMTRAATSMLAALLCVCLTGCGGALVRLAKAGEWAEVDRRARAEARVPRGKAARAWAQALVELGDPEQARAVLLRDFRTGGHEASLLQLARLEYELGLLGIAGAHYTRLLEIDVDTLQESSAVEDQKAACELLRARARAEAVLGEALAADTDMRRLATVCPSSIDAADREFLSTLRPQAQEQAEGRRTLDPLASAPSMIEAEVELAQQLELARKRGPRAVAALAAAMEIEVAPDDVAVLLAAEFGGGLGAGLVSRRRLSAWVGNNDVAAVALAIDTLPAGPREYALLRLASVRAVVNADVERQSWIVGAMSSVGGQGPHEAAKAWRVAAVGGDLGGAEFALNTNLRDMIPPAVEPTPGPGTGKKPPSKSEPLALTPKLPHWSLRVPVDLRSFDLLLTLARLFEQRGEAVLALELRRSVLVAGHEVGLAQVTAAAVEEVRRQLALGRPWQALALAEVVPGPLLDEVLPAIASAIGLVRAAGLAEADEADRNVVWRSLGDAWFEQWDPRLDAALGGLVLSEGDESEHRHGVHRCPSLGSWLDPAASEQLRQVGLDPERSRAALSAAFVDLGAPETGIELARALESDLALSCSAPLVPLLSAGPHALALADLDERLIHAPGLGASMQLQLHAEVALANGQQSRADLLTIGAAAQTAHPRELWARAAIAGRTHGAREYTIEALRQVLLHGDGLGDVAARRELMLMRLRDVDVDEVLRSGDSNASEALAEQLRVHVAEAPAPRRWALVEALLWTLASEPRADALAWALLLDAVLDDAIRVTHADAVAALEQAASGEPDDATPSDGAGAASPGPARLDFLADVDALCEYDLEAKDLARMIGVATTCAPKPRAKALAMLLTSTSEPARVELRTRILAGPVAIEIDPERPGAARSVASLARDGLSLRVVFDLPVEPVFVVDG